MAEYLKSVEFDHKYIRQKLKKFEKLKFLAECTHECSNLNLKINFITQTGYFIKVSGRGLK